MTVDRQINKVDLGLRDTPANINLSIPLLASSSWPDENGNTEPNQRKSSSSASQHHADNHIQGTTNQTLTTASTSTQEPTTTASVNNSKGSTPTSNTTNKQRSTSTNISRRTTPNEVQWEICPYYVEKICKYGLPGKGCKYAHPRPCPK